MHSLDCLAVLHRPDGDYPAAATTGSTVYRLHGVVCHKGNLLGGHYIGYVRWERWFEHKCCVTVLGFDKPTRWEWCPTHAKPTVVYVSKPCGKVRFAIH